MIPLLADFKIFQLKLPFKKLGLYVYFEFKILNHTNQPKQRDLSYPACDEHKSVKKKSCVYLKHTTQAIF